MREIKKPFKVYKFIKCIVPTCLNCLQTCTVFLQKKKKTCTVKFLYKKKHVMHRNTIYKTQLISAKPVNILGTA